MQPTSLVFVAIVGLWAAYLLPQWIRRRDALGASRTQDRHSRALRVLQRRRRERRLGPSTAPLITRAAAPASPAPDAVEPAEPASPASTAAHRRRTVLITLLAVTVLSTASALVGILPSAVAVLTVALLVADVVALRVVAQRERERRSGTTARPAARPAPRIVPAPVSEPAPVAAAPVVPEPVRVEPAVPVVAEGEPEPGTWTPVPVPPPTYTLKPMAPRPEPAPLAVLAEPQAPAASVVAPVTGPWVFEEPPDLDLDSVLERRRAVNG